MKTIITLFLTLLPLLGEEIAKDINQEKKPEFTAELKNAKLVKGETQIIEVDFILSNKSERALTFADRWNSWGAYQWAFTLTDSKGNVFYFSNPQTNWWANFLTVFTIPPGKTHSLPCRLSLVNRGFQNDTYFLFSESPFQTISLAVDSSYRPVQVLERPAKWSYPVKLKGTFSVSGIQRMKNGKEVIETNWMGSISTSEVKIK